MRLYKIPFDIKHEEKVFGGYFSIRQALYLLFIDEDGQVIELTFKDTPIQPELPKTGIGINITVTLIFIIGFSIISIICLIIRI